MIEELFGDLVLPFSCWLSAKYMGNRKTDLRVLHRVDSWFMNAFGWNLYLVESLQVKGFKYVLATRSGYEANTAIFGLGVVRVHDRWKYFLNAEV